MAKRKIIKIDDDKCNGCALCIPNCPEGALQVIDGKVRLVSDLFCDGLGACIGHCPEGAISIEERDAEKYDEKKVMANIVKQGDNTIKAHLKHLKEHGEAGYLKEAEDFLKSKGIKVSMESHVHGHGFSGCPGSRMMDLRKDNKPKAGADKKVELSSELRQWPVQIMLVPPSAPYLNNADLVIAADCVPFAYPNFHQDFLKDKALLIGCPKLDDVSIYKERFVDIINHNNIKSITYVHMEVPCCFGLIGIIEEAISESGKKVPFKDVTVSISGEKRE